MSANMDKSVIVNNNKSEEGLISNDKIEDLGLIRFSKEIYALKDKVMEYKDKITSEQHTKNAFLEPLIRILGYDTFNPTEVIPEYTSDFGTKKGEKVDYAILLDDKPVLLIEAKDCRLTLSNKEIGQLYRYFSVSSAKLSLLTNGIDYWFFTDNDEPNIMDMTPFFKFSIIDITNRDIEKLYTFSKSNININNIKSTISTDKFRESLTGYLSSQVTSVSNEFISFIKKVVGFQGLQPAVATTEIQKVLSEYLKIDASAIPKSDTKTIPCDDSNNSDKQKTKTTRKPKTKGDIVRKRNIDGTTGSFLLSECTLDLVTGSKLTKITIDTKEYNATSWSSLISSFIDYYINTLGMDKKDLIDSKIGKNSAKYFFSKKNTATKTTLESNGVWYYSNASAYQLVTRARTIFENFDIPSDYVKLDMVSTKELNG